MKWKHFFRIYRWGVVYEIETFVSDLPIFVGIIYHMGDTHLWDLKTDIHLYTSHYFIWKNCIICKIMSSFRKIIYAHLIFLQSSWAIVCSRSSVNLVF